MKKLKSVIFIMVLTTITLSMCAFAKSPLLLLQEGVYAEETEGDLDKAIGLYKQVIDNASEVERIAAKAAYKLGMCYLKKDNKESAAKYFQSVVEKYPSQTVYVNKAKEQLEKIKPQPKELPLFAQVPSDILGYISGQYAVIAAEAHMKNLLVNNNIYYLSPELKLFRGGYGFYQQPANSSTPDRIRFGGTTHPDQSFYDVVGNEMEVEIEDRPGYPGYYDIYWKPTMQLPSGQPFYYGWCINKSKTISKADDGTYPITMKNKFGSPVLEVFFLVLPEGFNVSQQSEDFTKKETVTGFDIYQWKKEVPANTNHMVTLAVSYDEQEQVVLENPFNNLNQPYTIWFRPANVNIKSRKGLLDMFNSIVNFKVNTYKFRTKAQGQGIIGSICTDGENGKDRIVELLNNSNEIKFIKITTPYVISFKANDPTDKDLLNTFNRCHPKDVSTHHFLITPQQGEIIGNICTDTSREKDKIVTAIEKSVTMVLVGITEPLERQESIIDLSMPETTIKSFVKAVYGGNLEAAKACVSKDGHDYDEFMEMLATESNHPFQAMIQAMDTSIPIEFTSKDITGDRCKIKWYFTLGRVYYFGDTKNEKGAHQEFGSYLELVGDKWLIRDI